MRLFEQIIVLKANSRKIKQYYKSLIFFLLLLLESNFIKTFEINL